MHRSVATKISPMSLSENSDNWSGSSEPRRRQGWNSAPGSPSNRVQGGRRNKKLTAQEIASLPPPPPPPPDEDMTSLRSGSKVCSDVPMTSHQQRSMTMRRRTESETLASDDQLHSKQPIYATVQKRRKRATIGLQSNRIAACIGTAAERTSPNACSNQTTVDAFDHSRVHCDVDNANAHADDYVTMSQFLTMKGKFNPYRPQIVNIFEPNHDYENLTIGDDYEYANDGVYANVANVCGKGTLVQLPDINRDTKMNCNDEGSVNKQPTRDLNLTNKISIEGKNPEDKFHKSLPDELNNSGASLSGNAKYFSICKDGSSDNVITSPSDNGNKFPTSIAIDSPISDDPLKTSPVETEQQCSQKKVSKCSKSYRENCVSAGQEQEYSGKTSDEAHKIDEMYSEDFSDTGMSCLLYLFILLLK